MIYLALSYDHRLVDLNIGCILPKALLESSELHTPASPITLATTASRSGRRGWRR